jgi:hypothetical protein
MKTYIEVNCFDDGNLNYLKRLQTNADDFLEFNASHLLDVMKKKNSDTAYYSLTCPEDKSSSLLFLVSKNKDIIDELKMKTAKETRTQSLFSEDELPVASSFKSLLKTFSVDQTHCDFLLEEKGEKFSFKVAYGGKANSLLSNLNRFLDETEMFKEVSQKIANTSALDRIKKITQQHQNPSSLQTNKAKL